MRASQIALKCALMPLVLAGAACGVIPRDGPPTVAIFNNAEVTLPNPGYQLSYAVVDLTPLTVELFAAPQQRFAAFSRGSAGRGAADGRVGVGDVVAVSVFEAAGGGLFLPEGGRAGSVTIPPQQVDRAGNVTIPYAGPIRALGRTTTEIQRDIEARLKERAIEPQVIVTVTDRRSNDITILGEVNGPTRFPAEPGGVQLLNALARAGGTRNPAFESVITVQRGGRTERALLTAAILDPRQNISIQPGDVLFVSREPRSYLAFGATASLAVGLVGANNRRFIFEEENLTLADGIAKAGGLVDERADSRGVFLYRMVPRGMLARAGVDVSRFVEPLVPTIFRVDLSRAEGFFIANSFYMQNKDIIFVSNSPTQDLSKFVRVINDIANGVSNISSTVFEIRNFGQQSSGN